jgi:hypothetical protein
MHVEEPPDVTQWAGADGSQMFAVPAGSHVPPDGTMGTQRELLLKLEPLQPLGASHAVPVLRHSPPSDPSAMHVDEPDAVMQCAPVVQVFVMPAGSHVPPSAMIGTSVTCNT